jgi:hypothetical protein
MLRWLPGEVDDSRKSLRDGRESPILPKSGARAAPCKDAATPAQLALGGKQRYAGLLAARNQQFPAGVDTKDQIQ